MTEEEWLTSTNPTRMLEFLHRRASERKLRLFACACCRAIWPLLRHNVSRKAVETAEKYAEGLATTDELWSAHDDAQALSVLGKRSDEEYSEAAAYHAASPEVFERQVGFLPGLNALWVVEAAQLAISATKAKVKLHPTKLLRDIFVNPFRSIEFDPSWRTPNVLGLAEGIYEDRAFDRMPILADALMDAGCFDEDILNHCRQPGEHVRGCWVVDLILGKE